MKTSCVVLFFLAFVCPACGPPPQHTDETDQRVVTEVTEMLHQYFAAIEKEGYLAEFGYLDSTSAFSWHPPGFTAAISFDSVSTLLKQNAAIYPPPHLTWDSLVIFPESSSRASYVGLIRAISVDTSGRSDTMHLREEGRVIKRGEGWKLISGKTVVR